jgi:cytochrome c biogenesis protein CcmG, thiol:disulfide interchange protein DsbE
MKRIVFLTAILMAYNLVNAQIPAAEVKTVDGKSLNTSSISNDGKPIVISFWATWCKPCVQELSAMHDLYGDWVEETGVKVYAVSIDNARSMKQVAPFANGKAWEYEILLDPNGDFKRAMNVVNVPHTFIINGKGEIMYEHTTYAPGDEEKYFEMIKKAAEVK